MDWRTEAKHFHKPCPAYYAGSANNVHQYKADGLLSSLNQNHSKVHYDGCFVTELQLLHKVIKRNNYYIIEENEQRQCENQSTAI